MCLPKSLNGFRELFGHWGDPFFFLKKYFMILINLSLNVLSDVLYMTNLCHHVFSLDNTADSDALIEKLLMGTQFYRSF